MFSNIYQHTFQHMDTLARGMLPFQVTDEARPDYGGWFSDEYGFASPSHIGNARFIFILGSCYFSHGSELYNSDDVFQRLLAAVSFQKRTLRSSGLLDIPFTNFDSPPDTAFALQMICSAAHIAKSSELDKADVFLSELEPYVAKCVNAILKDGFHTPNHRWVITSALLMAQNVFAVPDVSNKVNAYIREGIDINSDGFYSEKSLGGYNAVVNRAFIYIYELTGKTEFLDAVIKNLNNMLYFIEPDGSVVTSVSLRQDRGVKKYPDNGLDSFYYAALKTGCGKFSTVINSIISRGSFSEYLPYLFARHPEWAESKLSPEEPIGNCKVFMKESGIWRIRRGKLSLTAAKGSSGAVSLKYGAIELSAIRIFSPYFAGAKFIASELEETHDGIRIYYSSEFLLPQLPAYWMPTSQPVDFNELPYNTLEKRELKPRPKLYYTIDIKDLDNVFELHIRSLQGMNAVPFIAELLFVPNGRIESEAISAPMHANDTVLLKRGSFSFVNGCDSITVSGASHSHRSNYTGVEGTGGLLRAVISDWTPVDRVITLSAGIWTEAEGECQSKKGPCSLG